MNHIFNIIISGAKHTILCQIAEYLAALWGQETDGFVISTGTGDILEASQTFADLFGGTVTGRNMAKILSVNCGLDLSREYLREKAMMQARNDVTRPVLVTTKAITIENDRYIFWVVRDQVRFQELQDRDSDRLSSIVHGHKMTSLLKLSQELNHNIQNFLNGIYGYAQQFEIHVTTPPAMECLQELYHMIRITSDYINRLLHVLKARPEQFGPVQIKKVLEQAMTAIRIMFADVLSRYTFRIDIADSVPPVTGIESNVREVLYEVIRNGLEAMPRGGFLHINAFSDFHGTRSASQSNLDAGWYVTINITDRGGGIDTADKQFIFDPFFSTKGLVGKGFGLTLAYTIMKHHGGVITFQDNPDGGTTFILYFPVHDDQATQTTGE